MSTVFFKRGNTAEMDNTAIQDGMLFFNEENHKIYMDNGTERYQFGGDTELVTSASRARVDNALAAKTSLDLFLQKTTVVDDKASALAVTSAHIPLGCTAFKEAVGTADYSKVGDGTLAGGLVALNGNMVQGTLATGETTLVLNAPTVKSSSYIDVYTDVWKASPKNVQINADAKTITLNFSAQEQSVSVRVIVKNM